MLVLCSTPEYRQQQQQQHYLMQLKASPASSSAWQAAAPSPGLCCNKCLWHHVVHWTRELNWLENSSAKAKSDLKCMKGVDKREQREW